MIFVSRYQNYKIEGLSMEHCFFSIGNGTVLSGGCTACFHDDYFQDIEDQSSVSVTLDTILFCVQGMLICR